MNSDPKHIGEMLEKLFRHSRERAAAADAARPAIEAEIRRIRIKEAETLRDGAIRHLGSCGVPETLLAAHRAMSVRATPATKGVSAWDPEAKPFLLLFGGVGTGKSFSASGVLLRATRKHRTVPHPLAEEHVEWREYDRREGLFCTAAALHWANRYTDNPREMSLLDRAATVRWLVLDELRAADFKGAGLERLEEILGERFSRRLPTVITSNLDPAQMRPLVDVRLASRFYEGMETVDCGDTDLRRAP